MHLETKATLLILAVLLLIGGLQLGIHWGIVYPGFREIEEQTAAHNLRRCTNALNRELYHLDLLASDWAYWDDTYEFVQDQNADYMEANLTDETFDNGRLCLLYIWDDHQQIVYHRLYGIDPSSEAALHAQMTSLRDSFFHQDALMGLVDGTPAPIALASRNIQTSNQDGPCRGRLVMGRLIDDATILQLSKQTHVPFSITPVEKAEESRRDLTDSLSSADAYFEIQSRQHIAGYTTLEDIFGNPAFLVEMKQLRQITQAGKNTIAYSLIPTMSVLICTLFVCLYFLQHQLIRPINQFSTQLKAIRKTRDFHERVTLPREPEIRRVATEFNRLMRRLSVYNSKRNEAEAKLHEAVRQADYANRSKSAFLASMSHEIRTPMNAILGFSDLLSEEAMTDEQQEYVEVIRANSQSLLALINDILDLSKIEAGRLVLEQIDCPLKEQLRSVEILMKPTARQRGLEFSISVARDCPERIYADPLRLKQCLINLVGNSIKFTAEGHVFINVYMDETSAGEYICIAVEDTGIGISQDRQEAIFEPFTQSDSSTSRCFGGTGLGLTITRKLIGMMQGSLRLQSEPGKGSVFTISLPIRQASPETPARREESNA